MKFIDGAKFKKTDIQTHELTMIIGRKGTGKSVLTDTMLTYLGKKTFVVLVDAKDEYSHYATLDLKTMHKQKKGVVRITELVVNGRSIKDLFYVAEFVAENLFARENAMLVIEELGSVIGKVGRLYDIAYQTACVAQQGRKRNVGFIGISQRPQEVHTTFMSQADHIISFEVSSKHDLEAMRAYIDIEQYKKLARHEFYHYSVKGNFLKRCYKLYGDNLYRSIEFYNRVFGRS